MSTPADAPPDPPRAEPSRDGRGALDLAGLPPPSLPDRLRTLLGDEWRTTASAGVVVAVVAVAAWLLLRPEPPRTEDVLPTASVAGTAPGSAGATTPGATTTAPAGPLLVHAAGAVTSPGLYAVAPGSRVADLLRAAGGAAPEADLDRVNLAEPVVDGSRVYVPAAGEVAPPSPLAPTGGAAAPGAGAGESAGGDPGSPGDLPAPVDLNTATQQELEGLPGIGPATAQAIIGHRLEVGPFRSVDDLLDVRGIGEAKLAQLRPLVVIG